MSAHRCGCGKATFSSKGKADASLAGIKRFGEKREKTPDHAYPCPEGKGWHLTSQLSPEVDRFDRRKGKAHRTRGR